MSRYKADPNRLEQLQRKSNKRQDVLDRRIKSQRKKEKAEYVKSVREWKKEKKKERPTMKPALEFLDQFEKIYGHKHELDPRR